MTARLLSFSIGCLGLFIGTALSNTAFAKNPPIRNPPFEIVETIHVGGNGGYDYITADSQSKRLYIPRGTHTQVLDLISGKVVADIQGQNNNHGVAIDHETGRGFISDRDPGSVVVFDLKTNAVLGKVGVDRGADAIIYDAATKNVFVGCGASRTLVPVPAAVDPKDGKAHPSIPLVGKPESLVSDGQGRIFVNLEDTDQVAVIDAKAGKVVDKWSVAPGGAPTGIALSDIDEPRLFVACRKPQKLIVLDPTNGRVLDDEPIGADCDGLAYDNGNVFVPCGDGTLTIAKKHDFPARPYEIEQALTTRPSAKTIALGLFGRSSTLYLPAVEFEDIPGAKGGRRVKPNSFMILVARPIQARDPAVNSR